jgi:hypothetical protein
LIFRLIGSVVGWFRGGEKRGRSFSRSPQPDSVDKPDYNELTPYDIEDADYEELPKKD